jgi:hypothetical protein
MKEFVTDEDLDIGVLKRVKDIANDAIDTIIEEGNPNEFQGVNWADIECVETQLILNDIGDSWIKVVLSEADPSAVEFAQEVAEYIRANCPGIILYVETEW